MFYKEKKIIFKKKNINNKSDINNLDALNNNSLGYIASFLACASIPHSKIKKSFFKRSNGYSSLKIIADPEYGLPYGLIPRIIMIWLCTEVKLKKSSTIYLGKTQNEFIKKLGMTPTGGMNGTITRVKRQINRLFHSSISLVYNKNNTYKFSNLSIIDNGIFFKKKNDKSKVIWERKILLSKNFFDVIKSSSLPIDLRVIKAMRSPLAIDIYIWLTWRNKIIINKEINISWENLKSQFGANYHNSSKGLSNFKIEFIKKLKDVCLLYSEVCIKIFKFGLKLKLSPTHIPSVNNNN